MTEEQKTKLILLGKKTVKKYFSLQNKTINKNGAYFHNQANMTNTALTAFTELLGEPVSATWDEICEVFDSIKGLP